MGFTRGKGRAKVKYRITMVVDADTPAAMDEMDWALLRMKSDAPVPLLCLRSVYDAAHMSGQPIQIEIEKEDG